jgi:gamma-glutamyltranspeptidase/glutathione hydrolase
MVISPARRSFLVAALALLAPMQAIAGEAAIASAHPLATAAGEEILDRGGNAFDAAVAVSAALAVVEPHASGLGGGGFWLIHRAADGFETMIDGREAAPGRAKRDMYLDAAGKPVPGASLKGARAAAIPGAPAGLARLARYGRLPLAASLAPAIRHAREGFAVDGRYARMARDFGERLDPRAAELFLDAGKPPQPGFVLRQPRLAATLTRLAQSGAPGFYRGPVAAQMLRAVRAAGGIWQERDLAAYRAREREPLRVFYRGARITAAALPSSGGVVLAQALNMLQLQDLGPVASPETAHRVIEALRRAYRDRACLLGDPDFVHVPVSRLTSLRHAAALAADVEPGRATPSAALPGCAPAPAGSSTTHFSVVDREGNRVAATLSINTPFGSGVLAGDTGVLLNNEMDDFSVAPGVPNAYGLVGSEANAIAPGKRPLSSMTPAFVEDERGVLVLGTPGGSRIISMVLLAVLDHLHGPPPDPRRSVGAARYHQQYLPDVVEVEPEGHDPEWRRALEAKGHRLQAARRPWGNMQAVFAGRDGSAVAASDPRGAWY